MVVLDGQTKCIIYQSNVKVRVEIGLSVKHFAHIFLSLVAILLFSTG